MSKKSFKDNPALAFIKPQEHTQDDTQPDTQAPETDPEIGAAPFDQSDNTRKGYIRTQGRKGHKKPRINLAFDSDAFLDKIRTRAEREGKSITQFVNEAVSFYLDSTKGGNNK